MVAALGRLVSDPAGTAVLVALCLVFVCVAMATPLRAPARAPPAWHLAVFRSGPIDLFSGPGGQTMTTGGPTSVSRALDGETRLGAGRK